METKIINSIHPLTPSSTEAKRESPAMNLANLIASVANRIVFDGMNQQELRLDK